MNSKYMTNIKPEQYDNMELLLDFQGAIGYPTLDQRDPHLCHSSAPWPTLPIPRPDMYTRVKTPKVHGIAYAGDPRNPAYASVKGDLGFNKVSGTIE